MFGRWRSLFLSAKGAIDYSLGHRPRTEGHRPLDAEAARIEAVRGLIPAFEAKIQRVLARVWGKAEDAPSSK